MRISSLVSPPNLYAMLLLAPLALAAIPAQAQTITQTTINFDNLTALANSADPSVAPTYSSQGFTLTTGFKGYTAIAGDSTDGDGETSLFTRAGGSATLTQDNGQTFSFSAIDLGPFQGNSRGTFYAGPTLFIGTHTDGTTVRAIATTTGGKYQTFRFTGFADLTSLTFQPYSDPAGIQNPGYSQFDNIVVTAAAPVPEAVSIYVADVSGTAGTSVTLSARLNPGGVLSDKTVSFSVDGTVVGSAVSNGDSVASLLYTIPSGASLGSHTITASVAGYVTEPASSRMGTLSVTAAQPATFLSVPNQIKTQGQAITLTATVTKAGSIGLGKLSVAFTLDGMAVGTAVTNSSGVASLPYTIAADAVAGSHAIKAAFAGDATHAASSGTATLTVKYALALSVPAVSGAAGTSVNLSATLTKISGGAGVSGKTIAFSVDGKAAGSASTNSSGVASLNYAIPASASSGAHPVSVSFNGSADNSYTSTTGAGTLNVAAPQAASSLAVANVSGVTGQTVTLSATLTGSGGSALSGKTVSFTVRGAAAGTATTDSSGIARLPYFLADLVPVGTYTIGASFAGDAANATSSGTGTLTVTKVVTALSAANASGAAGTSVTLTATLTGSGGTALSGATLTFSIDGTAIGTATTDGNGLASLTYAIPASTALGSHSISVSFAEDSASTASSGSGTLTVTAAKTATSVYVPNQIKTQGQAMTLTATITKAGNIGLGKLSVSFTVDGVGVGTAITNSSGVASLPYTLATSATAGSHPVAAAFAGDATHAASSGTGTLTVKYALTLSVPAVSGSAGTSVSLSAALTKTYGGGGVSGKTLSFTVDGKAAGSAVTNSSGVATLTYAVPAGATVGNHPISVSFNGAADNSYTSTTGANTLTVR